MKKYFYLLLMVSLSLTVFAQTNPGENDKKKKTDNFLFAVLGGQLTTINGPESYNSPLFGYLIGFGIKLADFGNSWSINTSLDYSLQGSKYGESGYSGKVELGYLNLPICVRYQDKLGFYGEAGLQPGLLLSAKDKFEGGSEDFKDQVNTFDLGIPIGIGYHFKNGFDVGVRVVPGLLNLEKQGTGTSHNFTGALRASYYF